jgi:hypothetical protein
MQEAFFLGNYVFVNKSNAVPIYCLPERPISAEIQKLWMEAHRKLRQRNWDAAWRLFQSVGRQSPYLKDTAYFILHTIERFRAVPPAPDWDGSLVVTVK